MIKLFLIAILITSCGREYEPDGRVNPDFDWIVKVFSEEVMEVKNPTVKYSSIEGRFTGEGYHRYAVCEYEAVYVNSDAWGMAHKSTQEASILHAMSHCYKDSKHRDGWIVLDGEWTPESVMDSKEVIDNWNYSYNRDYYLSEL
jgi:hypothetical protein